MLNRTKLYSAFLFSSLLLTAAGCKKGTFDINDPNPNSPSTVSPKFVLSSALVASANATFNAGFPDFANRYMGYWAFSGDFGGYGTEATYNVTTGYANGNWDFVYNTCLVNYKFIETSSSTPAQAASQANYLGIAKIMEAFHFQRLVDIYNNVPYTDALKGGVLNYPKYEDAKTIYPSLVKKIDSAIIVLKAVTALADNPGKYDVMFGGLMSKWIKFGNSVKLKILMNLTQTTGGPALIQSELSGLTAADFLGAGEDAAVNPGYSNANKSQQNPLWQNVGYTTGGANYGSRDFNRANSYAVNFYKATNDTRVGQFYDTTSAGIIRGRAYGSTDGSEHNTIISAIGAIGHGILGSPSAPAYILPAFESLFLQAEAVQRGYMGSPVDAQGLYQTAIEESYRLLFGGAAGYKAAAQTYYNQTDTRVNWAQAPDPIKLILLQEWAALNTYDPITSWNNWRRTGVPSDLPVSIYPGVVAPHIPIRLLYPTSEYTTNAANVNVQGTIDAVNSKIFWMP